MMFKLLFIIFVQTNNANIINNIFTYMNKPNVCVDDSCSDAIDNTYKYIESHKPNICADEFCSNILKTMMYKEILKYIMDKYNENSCSSFFEINYDINSNKLHFSLKLDYVENLIINNMEKNKV
jgi:hypothetical protein